MGFAYSAPPLTPVEQHLKTILEKRPDIRDQIPDSDELTAYFRWMIREYKGSAETGFSPEALFGRDYASPNTQFSDAGKRLIDNPQDAQAMETVSKLYKSRKEEPFISSEADITVGRMMRYLPSHWHTSGFFEMYYSLSGECPVHFRSETVTVKPGTVLIVAPSAEHASPCFGDDKILYYFLLRSSTFDRVFWNQLPTQSLMANFFRQALSGKHSNAYLQFETDADPDTFHLLKQVYQESIQEEPYQTQMVNLLMSTFFVLLLRRYEGTARLPRTDDFYWKHEYSGILNYIQTNYATAKIPDLTERFHYSEKQIRRIVHMSTGMSFQELVNKLKMEKAAEMLKKGVPSVDRIAATVGYSTLSSFYRSFTRYYGCAPVEYLKAARES